MYYMNERLLSRLGFVELGDLVLYDNGNCRAGDRLFDRGVPIDGHAFGGTCVLRRRIDEPDEIEVLDGTRTLRFRYSRSAKCWYRQTPFESPRYEWLAGWLGADIGYAALLAIERLAWFWIVLRALVPALFRAPVCIAVECIPWILGLALIVGLMYLGFLFNGLVP